MNRRKKVGQLHQMVRELNASATWAILPSALEGLSPALAQSVEIGEALPAPIHAAMGRSSSNDGPPEMLGDIAVIPITGMIRTNVDMWSEWGFGTALPDIRSKISQAVESPKVKGILLYVDSPGGQAAGNEELSAEIFAARDKKPICTYSPFLMASAAYYLGSAASSVYVGKTATVGSIGVIIVHSQWTDPTVKFEVVRYGQNKAQGNPYEPLGEKGRAELQKLADSLGQMFDASVARNRNVSQETVSSRFGSGSVFVGQQAVQRGLADGVASSLDEVLAMFGNQAKTKRTTFAAAAPSVAASLPSLAPAAEFLAESRSQISLDGSGSAAPHFAATVQEESKMNPKIKAALFARGLIAALDAADAVCEAAVNAFFAGRGSDRPKTDEETLATLNGTAQAKTIDASAAPPKTDDKPAANVEAAHKREMEEARVAAKVSERQRVADITARGELLGKTQAEIAAAIATDQTPQQVADAWLMARKNDPGNKPLGVSITVEESGQKAFAKDTIDAFCIRLGLNVDKPSAEAVRRGRAGITLTHAAKQSLELCGHKLDPYADNEQIAKEAISLERGENTRVLAGDESPYNRPSSFPNLLSALANKLYDEGLARAQPTYQAWTGTIMGDLADLKPAPIVARSTPYKMDEVVGDEDFKQFSLSEEILSSIQVRRFGNAFGWTPTLVANDDLGAFAENVLGLGMMAELTVNRLCLDVLTGNPYLLDTYQLIDGTSHSNDITSGAGAPTTAQWTSMQNKVAAQTPVGGRGYIREPLSVVLVPPQLREAALQVFAGFGSVPEIKNPATDANVNIYRGTAQVVVEPELQASSATAWYGFCNPATAAAVVRAYFRGWGPGGRRFTWFEQSCQTQWVAFEMRVGVAAKQYRTLVRNPGA